MPFTPNLKVQDFGASLKILYIDNTDLIRDKRSTYLTEDVVFNATTMRVQSIIGFESLDTSSGQIICIGNIGQERTEILRTSQDTALSNTYKQVALRDNLLFDHSQDTPVFIIDFNRVDFQYAASATGTRVTLSAYPLYIQPDNRFTLFRDTTEPAGRLTGNPSTAFYSARFNDTIGARNSDFSDFVYGTGYDENTVFSIKKRAIEELGEEIDGKVITHEFLNQSLWQARREYHQSPGKRPFRRVFNVDIGDVLTGSYRINLPVDVERPHTAENVYGIRIGANANMTYYDKKDFDFDYRDKPHSTLAHPYTYATSTSIWIANGRDFGGSAVLNFEGLSVGVTQYTGSLTGESLYNSLRIYSHPSSGGYNASAGSDVFENISLGLPDKFAVWADPGGSAYIYFNRPFDTAYANQNIFSDYYRTLLGFDSNGDILDEPKYDMYVDFLKAKIKHRRNKGATDITQDSDFKLWIFKKDTALANEYLGTEIRITPNIDHLQI